MSGYNTTRGRSKQMSNSNRRSNMRGGIAQGKFGTNSAQGSSVEIATTVHDHTVSGVVKALSPAGDICISGAGVMDKNSSSKNGIPQQEDLKKISKCDIKYITVRDHRQDDCVIKSEHIPTDEDIARKLSSSRSGASEFNPQPFFESTDNLDEDCLSKARDGEHWFSPQDMFDINRDKFNVPTTFDENLRSYTIELDTSAPGFAEREARAVRVARDMERNTTSRRAADLENDEGELDEGNDEELLYSSVQRPIQQQQAAPSSSVVYSSRNYRAAGGGGPSGINSRHQPTTTTPRAEQMRAAFQDPPGNRSSQPLRHGRGNRDSITNSTSLRTAATSNSISVAEEVSTKSPQLAGSPTTPSVPQLKSELSSDSVENVEPTNDRLEKPLSEDLERVSLEPTISNGTSSVSTPVSCEERPNVENCKDISTSESTDDASAEAKKTSLNPDAPEFQPRCRPTSGASPTVDSNVIIPSGVPVPVSTMPPLGMTAPSIIPNPTGYSMPQTPVFQQAPGYSQTISNYSQHPSYSSQQHIMRPTSTPNNVVKPPSRALVNVAQQSPNQNFAPSLVPQQQQATMLQRQRSLDNNQPMTSVMTGHPVMGFSYQQQTQYTIGTAPQTLPPNRNTPPQMQQHHNHTGQPQHPVPVTTPQQHYPQQLQAQQQQQQQQQAQQVQHAVQIPQTAPSLYLSPSGYPSYIYPPPQVSFGHPNSAAVYQHMGHPHSHVNHPQQMHIQPYPSGGQQPINIQAAPQAFYQPVSLQNNVAVSQHSVPIAVTSAGPQQQQQFSSTQHQFVNTMHPQHQAALQHSHLNPASHINHQQNMTNLQHHPNQQIGLRPTASVHHQPQHFQHLPMNPPNMYPLGHTPQQHNNAFAPRHQTQTH